MKTGKIERDMTRAEIEDATENLNVDWGFVDCGTRPMAQTLLLRLRLWFRLIGRINQADYRTGPVVAWQICACIHPWHETVKAWGIVDDRRQVNAVLASRRKSGKGNT